MLVECRARRTPNDPRIGRKDRDLGSKPKVFGKIYHFRPQPDLIPEGCDSEAHVCEIKDQRAIKRFVDGLPEQFNEIGKPPRIPTSATDRAVQGQIEVVTELLDDDELGAKDAKKIDPYAGAKRLQQEWIDDMLAQPVKAVAKELHRYNSDELQTLIDSERKDKDRKSMIDILVIAKDAATEEAGGPPVMPPDDDPAMNLE